MRIDRNHLLPLLKHAANCADAKSIVLTHCCLLSASHGILRVLSTDYEVAAAGSAPCDGDLLACVPAKAILGVVGALPDGATLTLTVAANHRLTVESGRSRYELAGENPELFPAPAEVSGDVLALPAGPLRAMLARVAVCVAQDDSRPAMACVYLHSDDGNLVAVATDGHRLALDTMSFGGKIDALVPRRALGVLLSLLDGAATCALTVAGRDLRFDVGSLSLTARRVEGAFPGYTKVIPDARGGGLAVEAEVLSRAVKQVAMVARGSEPILRLRADAGNLTLDVADPTSGEGHAEIECEGDMPALALNPRFLIDLCAVGGTLTIAARDNESPVRVTSDAAAGWVGILMPMRDK